LTTTSTTTRNHHGGREVFAESETRGAAAVASSGCSAELFSALAGALSDAHIEQLAGGDADRRFQFIAVAASPRFQPLGSVAGSAHGRHEQLADASRYFPVATSLFAERPGFRKGRRGREHHRYERANGGQCRTGTDPSKRHEVVLPSCVLAGNTPHRTVAGVRPHNKPPPWSSRHPYRRERRVAERWTTPQQEKDAAAFRKTAMR
jgi:hypothetical protein